MIDKLEYCFNFLNDIYDATEGQCMAEITADDLRSVNTLVKHTIVLPAKNAPLSFLVLSTMLQEMSYDDDTASCPDSIAEVVIEQLSDGMTAHAMEDIYDAVHNLASILVKDVGQYK